MIKKFGKSYLQIMKYKEGFYKDNDSYLKEGEKVSEIYRRQPVRTKCVICGEKISELTRSFKHHNIKYYICEKCGHINGEFLETDEYSKEIYQGTDYGAVYREDEKREYSERVKDIYVPKAEFLLDSLKRSRAEGINSFKYLDVGAGSGYFVQALRLQNVDAYGIEVSNSQVDYGNHMAGMNIIEQCNQENIVNSFLYNSKCR